MQALLFDFDGLILDTESPEIEIWSAMFSEHGQVFPREYWMHALGRGADELVETPSQVLQRLTGIPFDHIALQAEFRQRRIDLIELKDPLPGVVALIQDALANGIRLAVVSSSKHAWVDGHLARLGLTEPFEFTMCSDDVERAKPYPDLYLAALQRLEIDAADAMALEDSPNGSRAAIDAGIFTIAVPNDVTRELDLSHASVRLESLQGTSIDSLEALRINCPR